MTKTIFILAISFLVSIPAFAQSNPDSIPFAPAVNYGAGDGPFSVFCADLAVANYKTNDVSNKSPLAYIMDLLFSDKMLWSELWDFPLV